MRTAVLLAFLIVTQSISASEDRLNIVMIISDDQAWNDYGYMGHPQIETPTLDRLAAESLTFTRGYVTSPLCRPSLASMLTGLPTHVHGITGNDPETRDRSIPNMASRRYPRHDHLHEVLYSRLEQKPNIVRALTNAGYATLQTGKWWEQTPERYGFTDAMTHGDPKRKARHGDAGLVISREGIRPIKRFLDRAVGGEEKQPFFIWHAPLLPHTPHTPPEDLFAKYAKVAPSKPVARYWAMCEWFDQTCGEVLNELDKRGLTESTAVFYVTDNGWIQNPDVVNKFSPRSKNSPYEGGVRTPISVRLPGRIKPRMDEKTLVSVVDLAPTILHMARLPVPSGMLGVDLRDAKGLAERNAVFGSKFAHNILDVNTPTKNWESRYVVRGKWKLINHAKQEDELFDLKNDPFEERDVRAENQVIADQLLSDIEAWWSEGV